MALIPCPECHHEVSDQAGNCPQCGYPLRQQSARAPSESDDQILEILASEGKIAAIKYQRSRQPGLSLVDAKVYVEALEAAHPFRYSAPVQSNLNGNVVGCVYLLVALVFFLLLWVIEPRMVLLWERTMYENLPPVASPAPTP